MPNLSIIVPCFNSQTTIAHCLTAVRASIYKDFELIVVDDHSSDQTVTVAKGFTDKIIQLDKNKGSGHARKAGMQLCTSDIICFIDSDIIIRPDTLSMIIGFLSQHPSIDAVTGLLAKDSPRQDFFSQYKNLYMHYNFTLLPEKVTFLFGSICAIRKDLYLPNTTDLRYTPDTESGQQLFSNGKTIAFLKDLEVTHLKKYTVITFLMNDFRIPFSWAKLFIRFNGWRQLGKNKTGFAHASQKQLASVMIVYPLVFSAGAGFFFHPLNILSCLLLVIWLILNTSFFRFLFSQRGVIFFLASIGITFIDHLVMMMGIICGFLSEFKNTRSIK